MSAPQSIDLPAGGLVISDLHLDAARADGHAQFLEFLRAARGHPTLLILGDLFDAWVGPAHSRLPGAELVIGALRELSDAGTSIALVHGNRDFLLDESFSRATGVQLCSDGILADSGATEQVLFIHGDELCTLDRAYQRLKRVVRSTPARWLAPRLPDALALGLARRLRGASKTAVANKPAETKRQQVGEVERRAAAVGAEVLICGHAHEFRDERLPSGVRWMVLDAFGGPRDLIVVGALGALDPASSLQFVAASRAPGRPTP